MKKQLITLGFLLMFAFVLQANDAVDLVLKEGTIKLNSSGNVDLSFKRACEVLCRDDFLSAIQDGYCQTLPEGEEPEFVVKQISPKIYHYKNEKGNDTRIEEVSREFELGEKVSLVLYSSGHRFFGEFQAVIRIDVVSLKNDQVSYSVSVCALPESKVVGFFARVMPVRTFFRHKTKHLTKLVVEVCNNIVSRQSNGENYAAISH